MNLALPCRADFISEKRLVFNSDLHGVGLMLAVFSRKGMGAYAFSGYCLGCRNRVIAVGLIHSICQGALRTGARLVLS